MTLLIFSQIHVVWMWPLSSEERQLHCILCQLRTACTSIVFLLRASCSLPVESLCHSYPLRCRQSEDQQGAKAVVDTPMLGHGEEPGSSREKMLGDSTNIIPRLSPSGHGSPGSGPSVLLLSHAAISGIMDEQQPQQ